MSEQRVAISNPPGGVRPPLGRKVATVFRVLRVRLRSIVALAAASLVVGHWETLRGYWEHWTLPRSASGFDSQAVSGETDYFCPMDPGVVSDWPSKCGICNMALVRRKKGEMVALPSGVIARMQFSPDRLMLGGIRTSPAAYRPLDREVACFGTVTDAEPDEMVEADLPADDVAAAYVGQAAEVFSQSGGPRSSVPGEVRKLVPLAGGRGARLRVALRDPGKTMRPGAAVTIRLRRPMAEVEPFRSMPADPPALVRGDPRVLFACPEHEGTVAEGTSRCPVDGRDALEPVRLLDNQRVRWWCPMHPAVTADRPGRSCAECGGMRLVPRVVTYRPAGQVLAVPESAVIDTGDRTVVFVESMPGTFDAVEVVLGPRCGAWYPVVGGLEPGRRLAESGAFLIDAETRLNPGLAAGYFGAARRDAGATSAGGAGPVPVPDPLAPGRELARMQGVCPVTGKPLGSMGPPVRVSVAGRSLFLCCAGCEDRLRRDPARYLAKLP